MHFGFLHNLFGVAEGGLGVEVWKITLFFSFSLIKSKCLIICSIVSARFIVLSFQSFLIANTRAKYLIPIFINIVAWKYISVLC